MTIKCPKCGEELELPADIGNRHFQCPYCDVKFRIERGTVQLLPAALILDSAVELQQIAHQDLQNNGLSANVASPEVLLSTTKERARKGNAHF